MRNLVLVSKLKRARAHLHDRRMLPSSLPFPDCPLSEQLRRLHEQGIWLSLRCENEFAVTRYWLPGFFADLYYSRRAIEPAFLRTWGEGMGPT